MSEPNLAKADSVPQSAKRKKLVSPVLACVLAVICVGGATFIWPRRPAPVGVAGASPATVPPDQPASGVDDRPTETPDAAAVLSEIDARVKGLVLDAWGRPVGGASVHVVALARMSAQSPGAVACDADGRWHVKEMEDGAYAFRASASGFTEAVAGPIQLEPGASPAPIIIRLARVDGISGRVVDLSGVPVANVVVTAQLAGSDAGGPWKSNSGTGGHFVLTGAPAAGVFTVSARGTGNLAWAGTLTARPGESWRLVISELPLFYVLARSTRDEILRVGAVRLLASEGGSESSALFGVRGTEPRSGTPGFAVSSEHLETVMGDPLVVEILTTDGRYARSSAVERERLASGGTVRVSVPDTPIIRGVVRNDAGRPVMGALVQCLPLESVEGSDVAYLDLLRSGHRIGSTTGADGRFQLPVGCRGGFMIRCSARRHQPFEDRTIGMGAQVPTGQLQIELTRIARNAGTGRVLKHDGTPLGEIAIELWALSGGHARALRAVTDRQGRFALGSGARQGRYLVIVRKGSVKLAEFRTSVGEQGRVGDLRLPRSVRLGEFAAVIRESGGRPLDGALLTLMRSPETRQRVQGWADAQGRVTIEGLRPGPYLAIVRRDAAGPPLVVAEVTAGSPPAAPIELRIQAGSLRGAVRLAAGSSRSDAGLPQVRLVLGSSTADRNVAHSFVSTRLNSDGTFEYPELAPGRYLLELVAGGASYDLGTAVIRTGTETSLEVRIPRMRKSIAGVVSRRNGSPLSGATVSLVRGEGPWAGTAAGALAVTDSDGRFSIAGAPNATVSILVRFGNRIVGRTELKSGHQGSEPIRILATLAAGEEPPGKR